MNSNIDKLIRQIEDRWLKVLYDQCSGQFIQVHLPSHDEAHHMRVWNYAKILLHHSIKLGNPVSETDIERLMIAVFFHDQGMSQSLLKEHGQISRHICKSFFQNSGYTVPSGFELILQSIEKHDQKDYPSAHQAVPGFDIQKLLNIADDLDALGVLGAYRYLEIYLLRNMKIELIPEAVLNNLNVRFQHFSDTFANDPSFVKAQEHRYASARNFYKDLNLQLKLIEYHQDFYLGPVGVVNYIKNDVINNKGKLQDVANRVITAKDDAYVTHFFERLQKELIIK